MNSLYDIFEVLSSGGILWNSSATGLAETRRKLVELTTKSKNEFFAMDLRTNEIVARMRDGKSTEPTRDPSKSTDSNSSDSLSSE
jgi:hypothetical protein